MRTLSLSILLTVFFIRASAQELRVVTLTQATTVTSFSFLVEQNALIRLSPEGKITEWGTEWDRMRSDYFPGRLQPFMGRVDYYGAEADSAWRGKPRNIGSTFITYYAGSETKARAGKVKSMGRVQFDYFDNYENASFQGKLKSAGGINFTYYASYENESLAGKLKTAGATTLNYYSSFDDKLIRGKIKSIGSYNYEWYTSNSGRGYQGALKTGSLERVVNGVNFIIY